MIDCQLLIYLQLPWGFTFAQSVIESSTFNKPTDDDTVLKLEGRDLEI
jgi:hypothetical protein